jgi:ElaB/YqjD/DUF883 family membrane-anchored ribosome-binding protein
MATQSEQLEREAEETRTRLAGALEELRVRLTPGQVVDQVSDYVRDGPAADFMRNLGREVRENPIPVLLIAAGIGWLMIASARRSSMMTAVETAVERDTRITAADEIGPAIPAWVDEMPEERTEEVTSLGA